MNNEVSPSAEATGIEIAAKVLPATLHILPLQQRPLLPVQTVPISVPESHWLSTFTQAGNTPQRMLGLVLARDGAGDPAAAGDLHHFGTAVRIHHAAREDGHIRFVAEGVQRFRILEWVSRNTPMVARVEYLHEAAQPDEQARAFAMALISSLRELMTLNPLYGEQLKAYLERFSPGQPAALAWFAASLVNAEPAALQQLLETVPLQARLEAVLDLLRGELEVSRLHADIREQMEASMSEQQRKHHLREQLKVIQKELGISKDDRTADADRFRERMLALTLSEEASARIEDELDKFQVLESGSPEYAVTRNYLDWLTGLPWGVTSEDRLDLDAARAVLDADHTGLEEVKARIIEFLAVGKLIGGVSGSIILLVGPPGVGKTSIGRSIAEALERRFYRFSVGGMRDEAEIKGHRRTYIGAMPGKFVQALKDAGTCNPVLMLDEVDKISASYQGDPASALLEVLDPEQNQSFLDHYLDVRFDLSRVLFVCTANQLDSIPAPLLDRMEVIRLSGYVAAEKLAIARAHLWPRQLDRAGIARGRLRITDSALRTLIEGYAREAGVRGLEKQLSRIVRKAAVRIASGEDATIRVNRDNLEDYLGKPVFRAETQVSGVGQVTGLAWTAMGGATLVVEASRVHDGRRGLLLTGNLGDVMRESAQIAYSFVTAELVALAGAGRGQEGFFDSAHVHLHVPEGATPKDGPSAGVTMATALLSLALGTAPRRGLAMTGELTLSGRVLAVGGIREKVVAARRVGARILVLPEANRRDVDELPDHLLEGITVHFAEHYEDVLGVAFPRRRRAR
jgi:ATP-dependent Lon protease